MAAFGPAGQAMQAGARWLWGMQRCRRTQLDSYLLWMLLISLIRWVAVNTATQHPPPQHNILFLHLLIREHLWTTSILYLTLILFLFTSANPLITDVHMQIDFFFSPLPRCPPLITFSAHGCRSMASGPPNKPHHFLTFSNANQDIGYKSPIKWVPI